jgi:ketosteroid isomerase-like protein
MENKEDAVKAYLDALARADQKGIVALCAPDHVGVEAAVAEKVKKFGGHTFTSTSVEYADEISPAYATVKVKGAYQVNGNDVTFQDEIYLQYIDGNWYMVLGKYKDAINIPGSTP